MAFYAIDKDGNKIKVAGAGAPGKDGTGIPAGGTAGQVLAKKTDTDQDVEWKTLTATDVGAVTGTKISSIEGLTQAEFDALTTKDPSTLYVVPEEE